MHAGAYAQCDGRQRAASNRQDFMECGGGGGNRCIRYRRWRAADRMPGMIRKTLALAACLLAAPLAHAWAPLGHSVIGELAERELSPEAAAEVRRLLRGEAVV